jgi:hypothetical protein
MASTVLVGLRAKAEGADSAAALDLGVANGLGSLKSFVEKKLADGHD